MHIIAIVGTVIASIAAEYADDVRSMFRHALNGYMNNAFPLDELDPVNCKGIGLTGLSSSLHSYHVNGGFMLTLVDSLSSVALIGTKEEFYNAVDVFLKNFKGFHIDNEVLVFEVNIRVLAGLLSAHQLLTDDRSPVKRDCGYSGDLLKIAVDLGYRLMPAFKTPTLLPRSLINLKTGRTGAQATTCAAAAGTFLLEFGLLSDLTGIVEFKTAAIAASKSIFQFRSGHGLVGNEINVIDGHYVDHHSGFGAGTDSFYEYLLKYAVYSGDVHIYGMWRESYQAIKSHLIDENGFPRIIDRENGNRYSLHRIDSLAAFLPGLFVLYGDINEAEKIWDIYYILYLRYRLVPEFFDVSEKSAVNAPFYLRPEFIESTYYLYQATKKSIYRDLAIQMIQDLKTCCWTDCGFAALERSGDFHSKASKMDSFFLAETLKYLYLILDEAHWIHRADVIFTTEAHPIFVNESDIGRVKMISCPVIKSDPFKIDHSLAIRRLCASRTINERFSDNFLSNWTDPYAQNVCYALCHEESTFYMDVPVSANSDPFWRIFNFDMTPTFRNVAKLAFKKSGSNLKLLSIDGRKVRNPVLMIQCSSSFPKYYEIIDGSGLARQIIKLPVALPRAASMSNLLLFKFCDTFRCLIREMKALAFSNHPIFTTLNVRFMDLPVYKIPAIAAMQIQPLQSFHISNAPISQARVGSEFIDNVFLGNMDCSIW